MRHFKYPVFLFINASVCMYVHIFGYEYVVVHFRMLTVATITGQLLVSLYMKIGETHFLHNYNK